MRAGELLTADGTTIRYQVLGEGPPIVLANGLGGSLPAWKPLLEGLRHQYTFYSWDYRGLFGSGPPPDGRSYSVEHHASDLKELLEHFQIERAVFAGWSFGGQVLMEAYRRYGERFSGMVLFNALVGPTTDGLPLKELLKPLFRFVTGIWQPAWQLLSPLASRAVSSRAFMAAVKHAGIVGRELDEEVFEEIAQEFIHMDHRAFSRILQASQEYDGFPVLPTVSVPTLVVSGTRDFIVLPSMTRAMAGFLPNKRLLMLPGTSHYSALEAPAAVLEAVEAYLKEVNYA